MTILESTQALAMLRLAPEEEKTAMRSLSALKTMADKLPGEEGHFGCVSRQRLSLRKDEIKPSLSASELLRNAPRQREGCFVCPAAFTEGED